MLFNTLRHYFKSIRAALLLLLLWLPMAAHAQYGLDETANHAGLTESGATQRDLPTIIGQAVNYLFGIIGVVFLTYTLVGGYLWMTAGGNEEKVGKAKSFIINGINGMLVIFLSYALVYLILFALRNATGT